MGIFKKAIKEAAKLRMAISGPSGSGKTYSALSLATHLAQGKPIALVDTEHGSASKYADIFTFDVAEMHPPFHPQKFIDAISEATAAGYGVLILDSISHAWSGTGGVLDIVDEVAKRSRTGNTYTAWKEGTPIQNKLIDAIVQSGVHIIVTMRSKTEYVMQENERGKQAPKKVGMAPVQRDQFEYEFDIVLDMDIDNNAVVSKTRCPALTGRVFPKPGADMAGIISAWLSDGAESAKQVQTPPTVTPVTSTNGNGHKPEPAKVLPFDRASGVDTHFNAIEWAMGQGVYNARQHAENSYKKLSAELSYVGRTATKEQTDALLWAWVEKVNEKKEKQAEDEPFADAVPA